MKFLSKAGLYYKTITFICKMMRNFGYQNTGFHNEIKTILYFILFDYLFRVVIYPRSKLQRKFRSKSICL